jgi:hypothetical protein
MFDSLNQSKMINKKEESNYEAKVQLKSFKSSFESHEETTVRHFELSNNCTNKTSTKMSTSGSFFKNTSRIFESTSLISPIFALQLDLSIFNGTNNKHEHVTHRTLEIKDNLKSVNEDSTFVHEDGGKGWLVVLASCWCFGIILTMQNTYSLLYNNMVETYANTTNHVLYAGYLMVLLAY